jgi:hypothetical protein
VAKPHTSTLCRSTHHETTILFTFQKRDGDSESKAGTCLVLLSCSILIDSTYMFCTSVRKVLAYVGLQGPTDRESLFFMHLVLFTCVVGLQEVQRHLVKRTQVATIIPRGQNRRGAPCSGGDRATEFPLQGVLPLQKALHCTWWTCSTSTLVLACGCCTCCSMHFFWRKEKVFFFQF